MAKDDKYDMLVGGDSESAEGEPLAEGDDMADEPMEPTGDPELEMHAKTIFGESFTPEKMAALKEFVAVCMAEPDEYEDVPLAPEIA